MEKFLKDYKQQSYWQLVRTSGNSSNSTPKDTSLLITPVYLHDILELLYKMNLNLELLNKSIDVLIERGNDDN